MSRRPDTSAGAIEKVSEDADDHQDDENDRAYSEGYHRDSLEGFSEKRKHSTCIQHCEPHRNGRDRHRLVGQARLEPGFAALRAPPSLAENRQIEKVHAGNHQENDLPVERRTRGVLITIGEDS